MHLPPTDTCPFQVELRHGRKSGIRKLYVNKELVERTKTIGNLLMDRGSTHNLKIGDRSATVTIERGKGASFKYSLSVDGEEIERDIGISAAGLAGELGTHYVRPTVTDDGFGMTLANCGQRQDGVVVLELECKRATLEVEVAEEKVDAEKDKVARAKAAGEDEAERDKGRMVELLNQRASSTSELETVLVQLSTDPEMKQIQDEHEQEKSEVRPSLRPWTPPANPRAHPLLPTRTQTCHTPDTLLTQT